jgi:hypothetical protein
MQTNRSRFFGNSRDDSKKRHIKSITFDQKSYHDDKNKHQSVVIYSKNLNKSLVEAIGPQKTKIQVQAN